MTHQLVIERSATKLQSYLTEIQALADSEKDALGFLPATAFQQAIERRRLIAALAEENGERRLAGYLLHSGVFPNAKVQQVAAVQGFRKLGVASALIKALVSELESAGFLSIRADIASDLSDALAFYRKNGFEPVRERAGGRARGRSIIIHSRQLETDDLFSAIAVKPGSTIDLGLQHRVPRQAPVFAFDLNVYFDLAKNREHSADARRLFGEALGHAVRLAVADEFVSELRSTSDGLASDPVLQMALQLPRLPKQDGTALDALAKSIHELVFVKPNAKGAGTKQAWSDARHLAHASLSSAAAFVTRDGPILNARRELLSSFGIDIATVDEVLDLLPSEPFSASVVALHGQDFEPSSLDVSQLVQHVKDAGLPDSIVSQFSGAAGQAMMSHREAIRSEGKLLAVGVVQLPKGVDPTAQMIIHVLNEHRDAELFAGYLFGRLISFLCGYGPVAVNLAHLPGQTAVNKAALAHGFHRPPNATWFSKAVVGRPLTHSSWPSAVQQVRRRIGLTLPDKLSSLSEDGEVGIQTPGGETVRVRSSQLEDLLGPTLFTWPNRSGVIAPIGRDYADELLGTASQARFDFIPNRAAAFLSLRGYVSTPRSAKLMRPGAPIVFYESGRKRDGRSAAVAVARIVNSVVIEKTKLNPKSDKRLVVEDIDEFSATDEILLTTFDHLMPFPVPVSFAKLKALKADGGANLVTAVSLSSERIASILDHGWSGDRT